jgi:hypothetical protein
MLRRIGLAALCAAAALPTASASAIPVRVGAVTGGITIYPNMSACVDVSFGQPVTAAGVFTSSGALQGPGTVVGVVRGALPVTLVNQTSWYGCLPDAYAGATTGYATYTFSVSTSDSDYLVSEHCTISGAVMTCV